MNPEKNTNEQGAVVTESQPTSGRVGPTIGIVIIIILILIGGLYYVRSVREEKQNTPPENVDPESQKLLDAITELETKLNASSVDIDSEVNAINQAASE